MKAFIRLLAVVAVLLFCFSATSSAQDGMLDDIKKFTSSSLIYPDGSVFFVDDDGVEKAIPFAVLSVYDKSKGGELAYVCMADRFGHYAIKQYDYNKAFTYVIEAPGFVADTVDVAKLPTTWKNGSPVRGNVTSNFELKRAVGERLAKPYHLKAYRESEIKVTSDAGGWEGLVRSLPGFKVEDGELVTTAGDAVRIKINDGEMPAEVRKYLTYMPCFMVSDVEVYTLAPGGLYGAVVNIVGTVGQRATKNFNGYVVFDGR